MLGQIKNYSSSYVVSNEVASTEQLRDILNGYAFLSQEVEGQEIRYIIPAQKPTRVTLRPNTDGSTLLTVDRTYKRLPSEVKRLLQVTRARDGSSSEQSLVERLNFELRHNLDLNNPRIRL